ncbi:MAG: CorA family divalent cation transporter, partial [Candidatus Aphodosoma sp.]
MAELRIFYRDNGRIKISKEMNILKNVSLSELLWIDLIDVTVDVESELEQFLKIYIQEEEEMEEIEISSRYIETEDSIVANSKFLLDTFEEENVSFILKNNILVSVRSQHLRSFNETVKKLFASPRNYTNGYNVFVALLETRVEYDADMIEDMTRDITALSNQLKTDEDVSDDILISIKEFQEKTMLIRENIVDKSRVCSNMLKSELFPSEAKSKLSIIIKDINSLFDHTRFSFDRL